MDIHLMMFSEISKWVMVIHYNFLIPQIWTWTSSMLSIRTFHNFTILDGSKITLQMVHNKYGIILYKHMYIQYNEYTDNDDDDKQKKNVVIIPNLDYVLHWMRIGITELNDKYIYKLIWLWVITTLYCYDDDDWRFLIRPSLHYSLYFNK